MRKIHLLLNEVKDRVIQENFKRILLYINRALRAVNFPGYTTANRPNDQLDIGDTIYNLDTGALETWDGEQFSSAGGDGENAPYSGTGKYSSRFNETVVGPTIKAALDQIFLFTAIPPTASLGLSTSAPREKGNTLASMTLTATLGVGSNPASPLTSVVFNRNGSPINTIPNPSGSESYVDSVPITDTTTYSITVTDADGRTATSTATINFYYPVLYRVGAVGLTAADVYSGSTKIMSNSRARTLSFTTVANVSYYAYPASLGNLVSILDPTNFQVLPDWTLRNENITGLDGTSQAYNIYEFVNPTTTTQAYTFS